MRCALVFYFVVTMFVVPYSLTDQCVFEDREGGKAALCGTHDVQNTFEVISPISQNITYIDMEGQPLKQLPDNAFRNLRSQSSLSNIVLRHCQIRDVDAGALLNFYNLTFIDLSYNDIKQIDSRLFSDTKQIKFIYMEYNKIEVLPSGLFQNLQQLEVVHLHHNRIRQVEWFSFKNTPSLRIIYLNNNQMEFINMSFKNEFDNLTALSLYGNPWKCDCELGPLYEYVMKSNHFNLHELVCEKPPTLQGKHWNDISRDEFICSSEEATSTEDSLITSTEPLIIAEPNDNVLVTDYGATTNQQVHSGVTQAPVIQNWILYTILSLVFVGVAAVLVGVVFVVRHTLTSPNRRRKFRLPTIIKQGSFRRTRAPVRGGQHTENGDSGLNSDEDVDEQLTSIHRFAIREATGN